MYNHNLFFNEEYEIKGKKFDKQINEWSQKYQSLMSIEQKRFLMSIISENNIKNILEIGIFNGVSSLCMLKAGLIKNKDFNLYSIDLNNNKDFVGQAVFGFCNEEELKHYHINIGKTILDIEDIFPKDIKFDLVFIDAGHHHPHPLFDLIFSVPYMHKDTIIVLHDIIDYMRPNAWGESFIFESWTGDKYRLYKDKTKNIYSYMGCIKLYKTKEELYDNIRVVANIPFKANPWSIKYYPDKKIIDSLTITLEDINKLKKYMEKYYSKDFANEIYDIFIKNYKEYEKNCLLYIHETRFFNYLYENILKINNDINTLNNNYNKINNDINTIKNNHSKINDDINTINNNYNKINNNINDNYNKINNNINNNYNQLNNKLDKIINMIVWWIPIKKIRDKLRK